MFKQEFRLWDYPPDIFVKLRHELERKLYEEAMEKAGGIYRLANLLASNSKKYGMSCNPWGCHSSLQRKVVQLWAVREMADLASIPWERVEREIEWYRKRVGTKVHPRGMRLAHDERLDYISGVFSSSFHHPTGSVFVKGEVGKLVYPIARDVFGEFQIRRGAQRSKTCFVFPAIIDHILGYLHPRATKNEPKQNITAYVLGVFTTKGCIVPNGYLVLCKKDEKFLSDISDLLRALGCPSKLERNKTQSRLSMSRSSSVRFIDLVRSLSQVDFSPYHETLVRRVKRKRAKLLPRSERKGMIIKALSSPKSVPEISEEIGLGYAQTCQYVRELKGRGVIKVVGKKKVGRTYVKLYGRA